MKSPALHRRFWSVAISLWLLCVSAPGQTIQLTHLGAQTIPTGTLVGGVEFGGISGLFYHPYSDRFHGITDDSRGAGRSRVWEIRLDYDGQNFTSAQAISEVVLRLSGGGTFPVADTEGLALTLDGKLVVSHEGLASGADPSNNIPPWIRIFNRTNGWQAGEINLPEKFIPRDGSGNLVSPDAAAQSTGVRSNLGLEGLGITPSRGILYAANEAALKQDDSRTFNSDTQQAQNSDIRIVRFTNPPGFSSTTEEKVYRADQGTLYLVVRRFNTVADILPLGIGGRLLVLERGLTQNNTNLGSYRIRIYEVDFDQPTATNVAGISSLIGASVTRLNKTLLWESSSNMDNVEALAWGRDVDGFRTLVLASDNNFSTSQSTQFHVLRTNIPAVPRRTLSTSSIGDGSIAVEPPLAWYPDGAQITLQATPAPNFTFKRWEGSAVGGSNPLVVVMEADRNITGRFFSPFQQWKTDYFSDEEIFSSQMTWPGEDPDGDGVPNLLEYALGSHPRQPSQNGLPTVDFESGTIALTYRKNPALPDVSWQAEVSIDLQRWEVVPDVLVAVEGGIEVRRAAVSAGSNRTFLRLRVTKLF